MYKEAFIIGALICLSLAACFKRHPINENALLQQHACIKSLEDENYKSAQTYCELCLEFDKSMPECLNGLGLVRWYYNDRFGAIQFFSKALRQNNDFTEARNNIGVIYFTEGSYEEALKYFSRALAIDPSYTEARLNIALSHARLAERSLALNDSNESLKELLKSKEMLEKLIAVAPNLDEAFQELGNVELHRYDLSKLLPGGEKMLLSAKEAFLSCTSLNKENDICYEGLGQVYAEEAQFDQAFANYFLCLTYNAKNGSCKNGIALAFEKSAQAEGGYRQFVKKLSLDPKNAMGHEAFCAALFERGLNSEAQEQCKQALALDPNICTPHYRLANYYAAMLNGERAKHHCRAFKVCHSGSNNAELDRCNEILVSLKS